MKLIRTQTGGYPRTMDPILSLQAEMVAGLNAGFANLGKDMVLQGCAVTNNGNGTVNIASGVIYVGGQVLRFQGATNIASDGSQAIVVGSTVDSNPLVFGDQNTHNLYTEQFAVISTSDVNNTTQIKVGITLYSFNQFIADKVTALVPSSINSIVPPMINATVTQLINNLVPGFINANAPAAVNSAVVGLINSLVPAIVANLTPALINASYPKGSIKEVYDLGGSFASNFDSTGLGTIAPWVGWALDNGNNGTPGSQGRAVIGQGAYTENGATTNFGSGQKLGEKDHTLSVGEMPQHSHTVSGVGGTAPLATASNPASVVTATGVLNTLAAGGGGSHNNMQPSIVAYRIVKIV